MVKLKRLFFHYRKLCIFSVLSFIFLLILPELCRFGITQLTPRAGWGNLKIYDIDLNVFNATLSLEQVQLLQHGKPVLSVNEVNLDINWWQTLTNELTIEGVSIDGLQLSAQQNPDGQWTIVAPISPEEEAELNHKPKETAQLLLPALTLHKFALTNSRLHIEGDAINGLLAIDRIQLQRFTTTQKQPLSLSMSADWNNAPISLELSGSMQPAQQSLSGSIRIEQLAASDFSKLAGLPLTAASNIELDLTISRSKLGNINADISGNVKASNISSIYNTLAINSKNFIWQGEIKLSLIDQQLSYLANNNVELNELSITDINHDFLLAQFEKLSLDEFTIDEQLNIAAQALDISNINALQAVNNDSGKLHYGFVDIQKINFNLKNGLAIDIVEFNDAQHIITVNSQGELPLVKFFHTLNREFVASKVTSSAAQPNHQLSQSTLNSEEKNLDFLIRKLNIVGDSFISIEDQRFKKAVTQTLKIKTLALDNISAVTPMQLALKAAFSEFSSIDVQGSISPFNSPISMDLSGQIEAVELVEISPYAEAYMGYVFTQGHLDHDFKVHISNQQLEASNKLSLRQLQLQAVKNNRSSNIQQQLNIPLDLALNMLRDSDDNIELDVPIKGQLDKLGIGLSDIISDALSNALKSGASGYLQYALQPYGAVFMAAEYLGKQANSVSFQPLVFDPGKTVLAENMHEYRNKIVALLQQRPNLTLSLCGSSNDKDRAALSPGETSAEESALINLAEQRGNVIKRLFIAEGVASKRLFFCQPSYKANGSNAVLLSM